MLTYLRIKDFAIIDETAVEWGKGFNVLTGETGAGKSIIVNAVSLLRGEKASQDLIRAGKEKAVIEAVFEVDRNEVKEFLEEFGVEEEEELILRRIITKGKNKVFINENAVTLSTLQKIAPYLIGIEGQHSQQLLLQPKFYLTLVDQFAGLEEKVKNFSEKFNKYQKIKEEVEELKEAERERERKLEFLKYQVEEIEKINPRIGEDEELEREKKLLSQSERLKEDLAGILEDLYHAEDSVVSRLRKISKVSEKFGDLGEKWEQFNNLIVDALYQAEEGAFLGEELMEAVESDPRRLEEVTARLLELSELKRKYGPTIEDILEELDKMREEIKELENLESSLEEKENQQKKLEEELMEEAEEISQLRKKAAKKLSEKVMKELNFLAMEGAKFSIEFEKIPLSARGIDGVNILISTNPGEPLKPLQKIASGGELSRIMLALRVALGEKNPPSTLIFDEIDAGIGGKTAESVGEKLKELSKRSQLIVITHLPQIALFADRHFTVEKVQKEGRTISTIREVRGEERIKEIARMLGKTDSRTLNYVKELMRGAEGSF